MTFADIIQNNYCKQPVAWWTRFAFHYTDVQNAVGILSSGKLYSRSRANACGVMKNDNASAQVIDMTNSDIYTYVRFYFRPMTPTQYYNEGYKHFRLRYENDINANVSVPIFFAFDLNKLLQNKHTLFSNKGQAGSGSPMYGGEERFSQLEFDKIYSVGSADNETIKYRHAELLYPYEYDIDDSLEAILCRNEIERSTLLTLLLKTNRKAFYKYQQKIRVCKRDMFEKNGLFLQDIYLDDNDLKIVFAETYAKDKYIRKHLTVEEFDSLAPISLLINISWCNAQSSVYSTSLEIPVDYRNAKPIQICNLPVNKKASIMEVELKLDGSLIGKVRFPLKCTEIV